MELQVPADPITDHTSATMTRYLPVAETTGRNALGRCSKTPLGH